MGRLFSILLIIFVAGCASRQVLKGTAPTASMPQAEISIGQLWFELQDVEAFKGWEGLKVDLGKKSDGPDAIIAEIEKGHQQGFPDKYEFLGLLFKLMDSYHLAGDYQKALSVSYTIENTPFEGVSAEPKWFLVLKERLDILTSARLLDRKDPLSIDELNMGEDLFLTTNNLIVIIDPNRELYAQVEGIRSYREYVIKQGICNFTATFKTDALDWGASRMEFEKRRREKFKDLLQSEFGVTQDELAAPHFCRQLSYGIGFSRDPS